MKQPLGIVAVLYAGGLLLGNFFQLPLPCLFAISFALVIGALLLPRFRLHLIWSLVFFTGWTNFVWHTAIISPMDLRVLLTRQELAKVRGTLVNTPTKRFYASARGDSFITTARLTVAALERDKNWQPAFGQIAVTVSGILPDDFFAGKDVEIYGVLGHPDLPVAEGLFDFRAYLERQEIYFRLKATQPADCNLVGSPNEPPPLADRFATWAKAALALGQRADDESLRLEQALTLGDKTFLTDEVTEPFVRAATYHIFAVDGLRLAILYGMLFKAFRLLRVPRTASGLVLIPLIWFYVHLTGWPASAIRAAVMLTIVTLGWTLKRPSDLFNSLFAAALIILIWQPQQLFQAGFQLSFVVVLCILLVMPIFDAFVQRLLKSDPLLPDDLRPRWQRILFQPLRFLLDLFFSSLAAWIGSIPLVAYYFHIITPISTLANVIAVPLCALVLGSNLISLLLAGWLPLGAILFNHAGRILMNWISATSVWFAELPHAYSYVSMPGKFTVITYYLILLAILTRWLFKEKWRAWRIAGVVLLSAVWLGYHSHEKSAAYLTALPLGGGSAIYCDLPGEKNDLLINCGDDHSVESVMKPYLQAQGMNSLPQLALTHGDSDEIGGFQTLEQWLPIEKIITSSVQFRSPAYRKIIESLEKTPARRQVVNSGDTFNNWTVLNPAATNHFPRADNNALVLRGEFQGTRVLLLANLGRPAQQALLERAADVRADIVVAGLPEQNEPLNDALLAAINPSLIIVTDSQFPATRRANRSLRERLEKRGIPVLCTSEMGAVKITLRRNRWKAETVDGLQWTGISPAEKVGSDKKL